MNLRWNASDYGGVKDLRIPPHRLWKPDVLMYNRYVYILRKKEKNLTKTFQFYYCHVVIFKNADKAYGYTKFMFKILTKKHGMCIDKIA